MSESPYLAVALEAARAAEDIIRHYFARQPRVQLKADRSPVTVADIEAEQAIKRVLAAAFPGHGFYGEETGRQPNASDHLWLIDPIDGTRSFIRRIPFFSTQIALVKAGERLLGVSNAPLFNELAWAERGRGAWLNDQPLAVSTIGQLPSASLSFGNLKPLLHANADGFARLVAACDRTRGYGDFYHGHLLAGGRLDVVLDAEVNILDVAALSVIVEEAGGQVSDLEGRPLDLGSRSWLATNGRLHQAVLATLQAG